MLTTSFHSGVSWAGRNAQVNWTRYLMAMRERSKFTRAVGATTGVMTAMYLLIGARPL